MILSHKHRFLFIKGVKVAGTSVEIALSQLCGPEDIITPITPADEKYRLGTAGEPRNYAGDAKVEREYLELVRSTPVEQLGGVRHPQTLFKNHMTFAEVLAKVPESSDYRLIFVERSPYAKVLSLANWERSHREYKRGGRLPHSYDGIVDAVDQIISNGKISRVRNIDRYRDFDGKLRSSPWTYGTLENDLREFCESCGRPGVVLVHAKKGFASDSVDVQAALRPDQISFIDELFADEFEAFGYPRIEAAGVSVKS